MHAAYHESRFARVLNKQREEESVKVRFSHQLDYCLAIEIQFKGPLEKINSISALGQ